MAIQARFLRLSVTFFVLFASGAFTPGAAEPLPMSADLLEHAIPPQYDDLGPVDLLAERPIEDMGSGAPVVPAEALPTETIPAEALPMAALPVEMPVKPQGMQALEIPFDPWAAAFAESSRVPAPRASRYSPYPLVLNSQVQYFVDRFTGARREVVDTWFTRSGRYLNMIRDVLRRHEMPEELAFVAMIESGFNPLAVSRAGAKGMWQFMAGTARRYGLRVDQWVDERLDPEKSTLAAVAYLRDLYVQFGSWHLAQAAYNAGEMKIVRAIKGVGSTDFWALARSAFLRTETKEFVPQIQAATVIGREPERYGFEVTEPGRARVETVRVPPSTSLQKLASAAGVPLKMLRDLNPVLVRGVTPPRDPYDLRIPASSHEAVLTALAPPKPTVVAKKTSRKGSKGASGARTVAENIHVIKPRETVSAIAKRYGVSVADLRRWNKLRHGDFIRAGDHLRVAGARVTAERSAPTGGK
jgi:soluble lytic murein transglycosylase-like protein